MNKKQTVIGINMDQGFLDNIRRMVDVIIYYLQWCRLAVKNIQQYMLTVHGLRSLDM